MHGTSHPPRPRALPVNRRACSPILSLRPRLACIRALRAATTERIEYTLWRRWPRGDRRSQTTEGKRCRHDARRHPGRAAHRADRQLLIHPYLPGCRRRAGRDDRGEGCRLRDAEGREYLDATGGLWLAQIGHGRAEIAEVAAEQMRRLEYFTSFWEFSNDRAIELASRLVELAPDRAATRLLHQRGLGGQRGRAAHGALRPQPPRPGGARLDPRPAQRVSRDRLRVGLGQRPADLPRGVRADAAPRAPPDPAVALPRPSCSTVATPRTSASTSSSARSTSSAATGSPR